MTRTAITLILLGLSTVAYGEKLTVIYDSGDTLSITPYKKRVQPETRPPTKIKPIPKHPITLSPNFPITTPQLSPKIVAPRSISLPHLQTPIFIIGSDTFSRQWLQERKDELMNVGAVGLLVEAESLEALKSMQVLGDGLHITAVPGQDIARQLGIKHYPVLISRTAIEQ